MISLVERGESSPTAVVLEKLATGLGVMLASLFDGRRPAAPRRAAGRAARRSARVAGPGIGLRAPQRLAARRAAADAHRRGALPARRARRVRDRGARRPRAPAGVGARGRDRHHGRRASATRCARATAWRWSSIGRRCSTTRRASRRAMPWCSRRDAAGWRGAEIARPAPRTAMTPPGDPPADASTTPRSRASPTCSIDCVEGGASVSFMAPLTRERAAAFWRRVAAGCTRRARAARRRRRRGHLRHRAARARPAREPAAPRRPGEDAGAPPRAPAGRWARRSMRAAEARGAATAAVRCWCSIP